MKELKELHLCDYVLLVMLGFLLACIGYINFAGYPSFYNFDMYSDILYAIEAWEHQFAQVNELIRGLRVAGVKYTIIEKEDI